MMRYILGMIAALPEFGTPWFFCLCDRPVAILHRMAGADRGDGRDFDDGYDCVAIRAARWKMRGAE